MNTYTTLNIIPKNTVMNTTLHSLAMQLQDMVDFSIQIVFTGTPTGSFYLEASCDPVPPQTLTPGANGSIVFTPTNWSTVANSSFSVAAAGNVQWNYRDAGYTFVRASYTDSSGGVSTAVITSAVMNGKGV